MDRRQNNGSVKAVSPRHSAATSALRSCCFNCRAGQSHKDNVRCTAVEEQPEAKEVKLSQPSSTSLFMIFSGLTWRSGSTSLLLISPGWSPCIKNAQRTIIQLISSYRPCHAVQHAPYQVINLGLTPQKQARRARTHGRMHSHIRTQARHPPPPARTHIFYARTHDSRPPTHTDTHT